MLTPATTAGETGKVVSDIDVLIQGYSSYLVGLQKSPHTVRGYTVDVQAWANWFKRPVEYFKSEEWDDWTAEQTAQGLTGKTIRRHQSSLRRFYRYLRRRHIVEHDPGMDAEAPGIVQKLPEVLTVEQIAKIRENGLSVRSRAILALLYDCGMRNAESREVRVADVSLEYVLVRGKRGRERSVPIEQRTYKAIQAWILESGAKDLVFPVSSWTVFDIVSKMGPIVGRELNPHIFRHSRATHLLNAGKQLIHIQEFLGHENINTTTIYTHVAKEALRKAILS